MSYLRNLFVSWVLMIAAASASAQIQFQDVSVAAGVSNTHTESWGVSWGDLNGDYYPDFFTGNHRNRGRLYRNNGDGTFSDVSEEVDLSNAPGFTGGASDVDDHGSAWGDIENDGDADLIYSPTIAVDPFLRNDGGLLTNIKNTIFTGSMPHAGERMPMFFDYNGDAKLDIFYPGLRPSILYRQKLDGTFGGSGNYTVLACGGNEGFFGHLVDVHPNPGLELICAPRNGVYPANIYSFSSSGSIIDVSGTIPTRSKVNDAATADFDGDLRPDIFEVRTTRPSDAVHVNDFRIETQLITANTNVKTTSFTTFGTLSVLVDMSTGGESTHGSPSAIDIGATGYSPSSLQFTLDPANPANWGMRTDSPGINIGYNNSTGVWQVRQAGGYKNTHVSVSSSQQITGLTFTGAIPSADLPQLPVLLLNTSGGWVDGTVASGLNKSVLCTGVAAGDFDNDMHPDLFLTCTGGSKNIADILYRNLGNGTFQAVANAGGAAGPIGAAYAGGNGVGTSENVTLVDYNIDGFLDLFVAEGNNFRPQQYGGPKHLFKNLGDTNGNPNHWIELDLQGVASNRDGIGSTILVTAGGKIQYREVNGGYHRWHQNHKRVHVGLGSNTSATIQIRWPNGAMQTHNSVAADGLYKAIQGGAITLLDPGNNGTPDFCGEPSFSSSADRATFLWKDCAGSGTWHLRVTGGGTPSNIAFRGTIDSAGGVSALTPVSIEANDELDSTSNPDQLAYTLNVVNNGLDGFDVQVSPDACFTPVGPANLPVHLGENRVMMSTATLNMTTGDGC
jgi:hypothetical protein